MLSLIAAIAALAAAGPAAPPAAGPPAPPPIEHRGLRDSDVLGNPRQLRASLRLTRWLRCRFGIAVKNVIGHNESLTSPYHHELVPALRNQTHGDWVHADMARYRTKLRALGPC